MEQINRAVEILNNGGIVIFPTDTAFGIGCRMDREDAVSRLFQLRKRPREKAVPLLASSIEMVENYVEDIPGDARLLMKKYWPGALTVVLKANDKVLPIIRGGGDNAGFRIPNNSEVRTVIERVGIPILGSSANFSGEPTPFEFEDLDKELVSLVDLVMSGRCTIKKASTVVDCTKKPFEILRKGAVQLDEI